MRSKSSLVLLSLALLLVLPHLAIGAGPGVHFFDCKECHLTGTSANTLGNDNVCTQCHNQSPVPIALNPGAPQGTPTATPSIGFVTGDASNQYGNNLAPGAETSHNWAATSTNPAAGAAEPNRTLHPSFYSRYGTTTGKVACSRCHNPHGEYATNPTLMQTKADRVTPMTPDEMCLACHKTFGDSVPANHGLLSHPLVTDYATFQSNNSTDYKLVTDDSTTAPDSYANGIQLVNGNVSCLSCHNLHFTDSNSSTTDGPGAATNGDGLMLRGDGPQFVNDPAKANTFCTTCHNLDPAASMHGSATVDMGCMGCHGGHNYNNNNPSYFTLIDNYTQLPIEFGGTAKREDLWGGTQLGVVDGFCETCHGDIGDPAFNGVRLHTQGEDCSSCHLSHTDGAFSNPIGCDGCHGSPPKVNAPGNIADAGYVLNGYAWAPNGSNSAVQYDYLNDSGHFKDETTTPHVSHAGTTSRYGFSCQVCHNTHITDFAGTHNKDNTSFRDVLEAGYTYDSKSVASGAANPVYNDAAANCNNVYCHSNGGVNDGAGARTFNFTTPGWTATKDTIVGQANECSSCHGNDAATMTSSNNSAAHQAHLGEGFSCNICHVDTATGSTALQPGAINVKHMNQLVDVVFDESSALKAGGSNVAHGSNPWGGAANVTCSAVYCHSSGQSVAGDRTYQSLKWTDTPTLGCTGCHDVHNGNNESPSHAAHVSGSTSDLGRNLDCGVCHADTVTVGDNNTITTASNHVNGVVNIKMNIFDDTTGCSSIDCHSDGNFDGTVTYKDAAWGTVLANCDDCHGDGVGNSEPSYPNGGIGGDSNSHNAHVGGGISCAECHSETTASDIAIDGSQPQQHVNKIVEIVGTKIDSYTPATETCQTAACHGGGSPQWGGSVLCGSCHAANNTLAQSHPAHYNAVTVGDYADETNSSTSSNYLIQCGVCHSTNGAGGISHAGGWVRSTAPTRLTAEVNFDGTVADASATYTPGNGETADNGFYYSDATCASLYCHGNFGGNGNTATPTWGNAASGSCGTCHDADNSVAMDGGAHDVHVKNIGIDCDFCHGATAVNSAGGITDKSLHVNEALNWHLNATKDQLTTSSTYRGSNSGTRVKADIGTLPYGSCDNIYCHSDVQASPPSGYNGVTFATPGWGGSVNCGDCHNAGPAGGAIEQTSGSHSDHVSSSKYAIGCTQCHQGAGNGTSKHADFAVDVSINGSWGGTYSGTPAPGDAYSSCNSVYCHSNGQSGGGRVYDTPSWGTTINDCVSCHEGASVATGLSGAHEEHTVTASAGTTIGKTLGCVDCHTTTVSDNTTIADYTLHVNGGVDVASCSTNVCHSDGNFGADLVQYNPNFATDSLDCFNCHGDGTAKSHPVYASTGAAAASANTHVEHVETSAISCEECHADTSTAGTSIDGATPAQHVDGGIDVVFKQTGGFDGATDTCSATYCHGSGTPQWGGTALNCDACHSASSALADSHGAHYESATIATAINSNNDSIAGTYIFQCGNCHNATTHAGGAVSAVQAAEVSLAGSGSYTANGTAAAASPDRGFAFTDGSCGTNDCHNDGTTAKGAPNTAAPQWTGSLAADCTGCHDNNSAAASTMGTGSHTAHVNDGTIMTDKSCNTCHNVTVDGTDRVIADKVQHIDGTQDVDLSATYGGSFAANACNNVYCHSDGQATPTYNSVTWGTTINDCVSCHDEARATTSLSGAHEEHTVTASAGTTIGKTLGCVDCHSATVSDNTTISTPANHVNTTVEKIDCSTNVCHSDGNFGADLVQYNPNFATDTLDCFNCHGDGTAKSHPVYASTGAAAASANTHVEHVETSAISCEECHADTSTAGTSIDGATPAQHVDGGIDVVFKQTGGFDGATDTCSATYCHGSGTPQWGGTALNCDACHSASSALADSHGAHYESATVATAINANNDSTAGTYIFQCGNCHNATTHAGGAVSAVQAAEVSLAGTGSYTANSTAATASPDRGFAFTDGSCGTNDCHNDGTGGAPNTAAPQWTTTLSATCTGCHNNNVASGSAMATGAHTKHINNANNGASKACQSCHSATVDNTDRAISDKSVHVNTLLNVAILGSLDGGNNAYAGSCNAVYCHSTGQSTSNGSSATPTYATATWATPASGACGTCHKVTEATGLTSGSHAAHLGTTGVNGCADCHTGALNDASAYNSTNHVNTLIDVANTYTLGGAPGNGYGTCSTASCHDDGTGALAVTPQWGTAGGCASCHASNMITGSHNDHLGSALNNTAISCGNCHDSAVKDTTAPTEHLNNLVDVYNSATGDFGGDYTTGKVKGSAYGSCATTYCHGNTLAYSALDGIDTSPLWGSTQGTNPNNCDVCHGYPPNGGGSHPTSTSCDSCHFHVNATNNGFDDVTKHIDRIVQVDGGDACTDCHGAGKYKDPNTNHPDHADHTDVYTFIAGKSLTTGDYGDPAKGWFDVTYDATGRLVAGCGQCHPDDQATFHLSGAVDMQLDPNSATQTIPTPNAKRGNTGESYSGGQCSAVYCHSDGAGTYDTTPPTWGGVAENLTCGDCHGNSPTTNAHSVHEVGIHYEELYDDDGVGLMASSTADIGLPDTNGGTYGNGAAHGNSSLSTTINCFTCHNVTVVDSANAGNSTCVNCHSDTDSIITGNELARIQSSSTVHLNGQKDVSFADLTVFKSKAQLREDISLFPTLNANWSRPGGSYKVADGTSFDQAKVSPTFGGGTCSTIACHNGIDANWTDPVANNCMKCHTELPK